MSDLNLVEESQPQAGKQRFTIDVPTPGATINMGTPINTSDRQFGYPGISLTSAAHLLIDVNKATLYQSGTSACWQVGGKWLQYSNGPMFISSTDKATLSASANVSIAAGAGQGQVTAIPFGAVERLVDYNNLQLHYRVDEIQNGLKSFLYGDTWKTHERTPTPEDLATVGDGFLKDVKTFLDEVVDPSGTVASQLTGHFLWKKNHFSAYAAGSPWIGFPVASWTTSVFPALNAIDPYAAAAFEPTSGWKVFVAGAKAFYAFCRRVADVVGLWGSMITDNVLSKKLLTIGNLLTNVTAAYWSGLKLHYGFTGNADEKAQWGYSFKSEAALVKSRADSFKSPDDFQATLTSKDGPFDLSTLDEDLVFKVKVDGKVDDDSATYHELRLAIRKATTTLDLSTVYTSVTIKRSSDATAGAGSTVTVGSVAINLGPFVNTENCFGTQSDIQTQNQTLPAGTELVVSADRTQVILRSESPISYTLGSNTSLVTTSFAGLRLTVAIGGTTKTVLLTDNPDVDINALFANLTHPPASWNATTKKLTLTHQGFDAALSVSVTLPDGTVKSATATGYFTDPSAVTATDLHTQLSSQASGFTLSVSGSALEIKSPSKGRSSKLKADATHAGTYFPFLLSQWNESGSFDWFRNAVFEAAKWPEDLRNLLRPVKHYVDDMVDLVKQAMAVLDTINEVFELNDPKSRLGLIGKDGITLGSRGQIFATSGGGMLFTVGNEEEANEDKYVITEKLVRKITDDWSSFSAIYNALKKKKPAPGVNPGFRVLSKSDVSLVAGTTAELISVGKTGLTRVAGHLVTIDSRDRMHLRSSERLILEAEGANSVLEGGGERTTLYATNNFMMTGGQDISLDSGTTRLHLNGQGNAIMLGSSAANGPHVAVDTNGGSASLAAGNLAAAHAHVSVAGNNNEVSVVGDAVNVTAGNGMTVTGNATINGNLQVGQALMVRNAGVAMPQPPPNFAVVQTEMAGLQQTTATQQQEIVTLQGKVQTAELAIDAAQVQLKGLEVLNALKEQVEQYIDPTQKELLDTVSKLVEELEKTKSQLNALQKVVEGSKD